MGNLLSAQNTEKLVFKHSLIGKKNLNCTFDILMSTGVSVYENVVVI